MFASYLCSSTNTVAHSCRFVWFEALFSVCMCVVPFEGQLQFWLDKYEHNCKLHGIVCLFPRCVCALLFAWLLSTIFLRLQHLRMNGMWFRRQCQAKSEANSRMGERKKQRACRECEKLIADRNKFGNNLLYVTMAIHYTETWDTLEPHMNIHEFLLQTAREPAACRHRCPASVQWNKTGDITCSDRRFDGKTIKRVPRATAARRRHFQKNGVENTIYNLICEWIVAGMHQVCICYAPSSTHMQSYVQEIDSYEWMNECANTHRTTSDTECNWRAHVGREKWKKHAVGWVKWASKWPKWHTSNTNSAYSEVMKQNATTNVIYTIHFDCVQSSQVFAHTRKPLWDFTFVWSIVCWPIRSKVNNYTHSRTHR